MVEPQSSQLCAVDMNPWLCRCAIANAFSRTSFENTVGHTTRCRNIWCLKRVRQLEMFGSNCCHSRLLNGCHSSFGSDCAQAVKLDWSASQAGGLFGELGRAFWFGNSAHAAVSSEREKGVSHRVHPSHMIIYRSKPTMIGGPKFGKRSCKGYADNLFWSCCRAKQSHPEATWPNRLTTLTMLAQIFMPLHNSLYGQLYCVVLNILRLLYSSRVWTSSTFNFSHGCFSK